MKRCRRCQEIKPETAFAKGKSKKDGLYAYCRPCGSITNREYLANLSFERRKRRHFARNIKKLYGLEAEDFEQILLNQQNRCAVCQLEFKKSPHVDHCHKTGKIRGLLCSKCNIGIGQLRDSPALCVAAAAYLEKT